MAFGKSLELAAIQPPGARILVAGRTYLTPEKAAARKLELKRFGDEAAARKKAMNAAFEARNEARQHAGLEPLESPPEAWPSVAQFDLSRAQKSATQAFRRRRREWRKHAKKTGAHPIERMFAALAELCL